MKTKQLLSFTVAALFFSPGANRAAAQVPVVGVVSGIVKKVIIALDLKVQQLQNETIELQNAEAGVENTLHLNSLHDIGGWLGKERSLYQQYYQELATVRGIIADYDEVRRIISQQEELVSEYHSASMLFRGDRHFSAGELRQMDAIYGGILKESMRNLDEVLTAVRSFGMQMSDAERIGLIHTASAGMQGNLNRLRQFNTQNIQLSLARAGDEHDRVAIRRWYGLE